MQEQLAAVQAQLAEETTTASVGGGAIKVIMTGDQHCKGVEISADLLKDADPEMLQDLVLSAVQSGIRSITQMAEERMGHWLAVFRVSVFNDAGLPEPVQNLVNAFERLPGIGPKRPSRLTFIYCAAPQEISTQLAEALTAFKNCDQPCARFVL